MALENRSWLAVATPSLEKAPSDKAVCRFFRALLAPLALDFPPAPIVTVGMNLQSGK